MLSYEYEIIEAIETKLIEEQENKETHKEQESGQRRKCRWSKEQKKWFLRRDDYHCQLNGCNNTNNLQGHHIIASQYAINVLLWPIWRINSPFNGIILCDYCHRVMIHQEIMIKYTAIVKKQRQKFLQQRPYWNTNYDKLLKKTAITRTNYYLQAHPEDLFPTKEHNYNDNHNGKY